MELTQVTAQTRWALVGGLIGGFIVGIFLLAIGVGIRLLGASLDGTIDDVLSLLIQYWAYGVAFVVSLSLVLGVGGMLSSVQLRKSGKARKAFRRTLS